MSSPARVAVVTGVGRRVGIGAAICRELAKRGIDVMLTYWRLYDDSMDWGADSEMPQALLDELARLGVRSAATEIDLSAPDAPQALLDTTERDLGRPSILVNNATVSRQTDLRSLTSDDLDAHYAVNLRATALLCVEMARRHPTEQSGRIVNITSGQSLGPMPDELAYAATKGAIEALTVSLAPPLAERGITINAVNPGPTETGWISDELRERLLRRAPAGRLGAPEDCARLVAFLVSDEAGWITGQVIHSEGGFIRG